MTEKGADRVVPRWRQVTPYAIALIVVVSAYPFVAFLDRNRDEIAGVGPLVTYLIATVVVSLLVLLALVLLLRRLDVDRLAVGLAVFLLSFWGFHLMFSDAPQPGRRLPQLLLWALLTACLVVLTYRLARSSQLRFFLLTLVSLLAVLPLGEYVIWRLTTDDTVATAEAREAQVDPADVAERPNVYYFVLDEYGRNDQLREVLGYDNAPFYESLRERDFVVVENSHSPFQQTIMSMASVLDMDYVATTPEEAPRGNMPFADRLRGDNATVDYFKALGYDYVYAAPGKFSWNRCDPDIADLCIEAQSTGVNLTEMEMSLLDLTPIGSLDIVREAVNDPAYVVDQLDQHRSDVEEPFFLYSHTLNPHGPFRYTDDCGLRDRFAYSEHVLDKSELDERNYLQDLGCLNELVLDGVDAILEDDPDAVIIVASDHGSKFIPDGFKRLEEWRDAAVREEFGTLFAVHAPAACEDDFDAIVNTIDTFRVLSACLEGREPEPAENRAFVWPAEGPGPQEVDDVDDLSAIDP